MKYPNSKPQVKTSLFSGTLILVNPQSGEQAIKRFNNAIAKIGYSTSFGTIYKINGRTYRQI